MGHLLLIALHGAAALVYWPALFVTVPAHLVYTLIAAKLDRDDDARSAAAALEAEKRTCHACAERVQRAATVCRYCGTQLPPLPVDPRITTARQTGAALAKALRAHGSNNPHL
jgi:hypothetical protein